MKGGQTIQFAGESDQAPGAQTGDVIIVIEEKQQIDSNDKTPTYLRTSRSIF